MKLCDLTVAKLFLKGNEMFTIENEEIECDKATNEWFEYHPGARITIVRCEKCGLYFKPSLGHECEVEE